MLDVTSAYNYYSMSLSKHSNSKLESHKNSELKNVYSKIIKLNQLTPLYLINFDKANQDYAIGIKEAAIELNQIANVLGDEDDETYQDKLINSSDESKIFAKLNNSDYSKVPDPLSLEVESLASHQINIGNYVKNDYQSLAAKVHYFNIVTNENTYSFSVSIDKHEHNLTTQNKLVQVINESNIPIKASLDERDSSSAIILEGDNTGDPKNDYGLSFWVEDKSNGNSLASVFGLNKVFQYPEDSVFSINGEEHTSSINNISINNTVSLDLLAPTNKPVDIFLTPNYDKVSKTVDDFVDSYNNLVNIASSNSKNPRGSKKLLNDMTNLIHKHKDELTHLGLSLGENDILKSNDEYVSNSIRSNSFQELFNDDSTFKSEILRITDKLTLDPLGYIDKTIVSYPNSTKNFPNPYVPSRYTGLLYNRYL